jgi:hypothetical protein
VSFLAVFRDLQNSPPCPRHFRIADQSLNLGLEFYKHAESDQARRPRRELDRPACILLLLNPGIRLQLRHANRDAPPLGINLGP